MGSKGSSTTSFTPPPEVVEAYKEALGYGRAAMGQQYAPYTGEITAPLTPTQESGIYNVNRAVGTAIPFFGRATELVDQLTKTPIAVSTPGQLSQASQLATGATGVIAPVASPQIAQATKMYSGMEGQTITPQQSAEIAQATGLTGNVANQVITPDQFSQAALQPYMSPYTQAVADATFRNLREQQMQEQTGLRGGAIRAGAFGGDRAGIAAANMARQQDLATAQAMSNIYNQGYTQATGLFGQQQAVNLAAQQANAARQLQAAQQLAGIGAQQQSVDLAARQADAARQMQVAQQLAGIGTQQQGVDLAARQSDAARQLQAAQQLSAIGLQQQALDFQAQQANKTAQMQAAQQLASLGTGLQGSVLQGAQAQLAAGAQQQAVQQAINSGYYNQYLGAQAYPYQQAQFFANLATGVGGQMGGTTTGTPAQPSPVGSIFGALGAIGSVMSDKRAKENIKPIGKTNDGQTIYRFNYKGDHTTQIGLLAQEVEKKHPEAVTTINGMKGVDYKEATDDSVRSMGGGVVPSSVRKDFAAGGPSISDEEDPMIPYKAGVPAKVLQIPKLARIGGNKPNFGGELPKQPGGGPSEKDFKGAAAGLGAIYDKFSTPSAAESGAKIVAGHEDFMNMLSNLSFALGGATSARRRRRFADGDEVPVTEDTKPVNTAPEPGLSPKSDLPPAFQKGEISGQADAEGTPVGGVVPRPDIPLPPESSDRPRDLSFPLLRREEGYVPKAFWDVNAPRVGYSTDTKTSPEGVVTRVQRGDTMTREEAERDLTRRVVEGQNWIKSQIGEENWDRLTPEAKAAMTSIRYQYGQYPKSVLVAAASGDEALLAKAIEAAPSPTPDRMKRQANLTRGQDQGLGAYEPEGARYLKGGLGPIAGGGEGGGAGGSRKAPEASMAATDVATGDRKWNLGMAGEGKRSIIESIMDRDFDPIQKRALFSFFAGMAASPSPWFGQQLGAGMQAASNVYNESMNKQAELDIRKQQLGMEKERVDIQERLAGVQEKTKAIEALKFWQSRFKQIPTPEGFAYLDTTTGQTISQDEYNAQMANVMKQYKLSPGEAGTTMPKPGLAPVSGVPAAGAEPAGGLVPAPKPEAKAEPEVTGGAEPAPVTVPKPTEVPKPTVQAKPVEAPAKPAEPVTKPVEPVKPKGETETTIYQNVRDDYNPIVLRGKADEQRRIATNAQKLGDLAGAKAANDLADSYSKKAVDITENKVPVVFKDGTVGRIPQIETEALRTEGVKESQKINVAENTKWMNAEADAQAKRDMLSSRINQLANILETYESGRFAEQKANLVASLKAMGINVPNFDTSNPAKFEEFIKNQINNVFDEVKAIGGQVRVAEIQGLQQAQAGPGMQPEANRAILGYSRGMLNWENKRFDDAVETIDKTGIQNFNRPKWMKEWSKSNDLNDYVKKGKQSIGALGATPDNPSDLDEGQTYILREGQFGAKKRGKYIYRGIQEQGGRRGLVFEPVGGQ